MHLIQLLLPLYDNDSQPQPRQLFIAVRDQLIERFGGLTAYNRAPADGLWQEGKGGDTMRDDLVIYEVMAQELDARWWQAYRADLEQRFRQEKLIVRAQGIMLL